METVFQDIRFAFRSMFKSPGFAIAAILTLALGIGANTAIFTVTNRALREALPIAEPERMMQLVTERGPDNVNSNLSYPTFADLRDNVSAFSGVLASTGVFLAFSTPAGVDRIEGSGVSAPYFSVLGVPLAAGRDFLREENDPVAPAQVVILSHGLWQRRFGGDPEAVGRSVTINGRAFTIIGVTSSAFTGMIRGSRTDAWIPVATEMDLGGRREFATERRISWLDVFARLAPGIDSARAIAELDAFDQRLTEGGEQPETYHTRLRPGGRGLRFLVGEYEGPLKLLMIVVAVVLLIACANIANLLLARAGGRRREIGVRLSIGATRSRLVRQLLTESMLLAVMGGGAGILVAVWMQEMLLSFRPSMGGTVLLPTGPDGAMLAFTAAISLLTGIAFGLVPALQASRPNLALALKEGGAGASGVARGGIRGALVVGQLALSLVLLVGAGLLLRSLSNLNRVDLGFDRQANIVLATLDLETAGYERERGLQLYESLLTRLAAQPGIQAASLAQTITPSPAGANMSGLRLDSGVPEDSVSFDVNIVSPGYFDAIGTPVLRGRLFTSQDRTGAPRVAIINESMARRYWPGRDAIGGRIYLDSTIFAEVVGVVRDGRYRGVREHGETMVYFPLLQRYRPAMTVVVRGAPGAPDLPETIRREVTGLDPQVPAFDIRSLQDHVDSQLSQDRMIATLTTLFATLALSLASLGLYGVMSYFVSQRTREIGVRIALGARWSDVLGLILRRGMLLVGIGMVLGVAGSLAATRLISTTQLYEVAATDPLVYGGLCALLAGVAALAAYVPARRAARLDPITALRHE